MTETAGGFRGITAPLWPIRYKPLPDELLSSWLVRLAHGHGLKVQTFCNLIFGNRRQVWNRDVDRLAPPWLVDTLARHTGTPLNVAYGTTLKVFDGVLFRNPRPSGHLNWVQSLKIYHRVRKGFGQQYCPACLASDEVPYFRKLWRLSLSTVCLRHRCMLQDRCYACGAAVSFFRMDFGTAAAHSVDAATSVARCHDCKSDLGAAPTIAPLIVESGAYGKLIDLNVSAQGLGDERPDPAISDELDVLRHLCALMLSKKASVKLRGHLLDAFSLDDPVSPSERRIPMESLPTGIRHILLQCGAWLLNDLAVRLSAAVKSGNLRYSHLLRDFEDAPAWYCNLVAIAVPHRNAPAQL